MPSLCLKGVGKHPVEQGRLPTPSASPWGYDWSGRSPIKGGVCAEALTALAPDDQQARVGTQSAPSPVLRLWNRSDAGSPRFVRGMIGSRTPRIAVTGVWQPQAWCLPALRHSSGFHLTLAADDQQARTVAVLLFAFRESSVPCRGDDLDGPRGCPHAVGHHDISKTSAT